MRRKHSKISNSVGFSLFPVVAKGHSAMQGAFDKSVIGRTYNKSVIGRTYNKRVIATHCVDRYDEQSSRSGAQMML